MSQKFWNIISMVWSRFLCILSPEFWVLVIHENAFLPTKTATEFLQRWLAGLHEVLLQAGSTRCLHLWQRRGTTCCQNEPMIFTSQLLEPGSLSEPSVHPRIPLSSLVTYTSIIPLGRSVDCHTPWNCNGSICLSLPGTTRIFVIDYHPIFIPCRFISVCSGWLLGASQPQQGVARWVWPLPSTKIQWPRTC